MFSQIVERDHPDWVTELPTVLDLKCKQKYIGLLQCLQYWQLATGQSDLADKLISDIK